MGKNLRNQMKAGRILAIPFSEMAPKIDINSHHIGTSIITQMLSSAIQIKKRRGIFQHGQVSPKPSPPVQPNPNQPLPHNQPSLQGKSSHEHQIILKQALWGNDHHDHQWQAKQAKQHQFSLMHLDSFEVLKYIEHQIVQMEESPSKKKIQELKQKGLKFNDTRFPPNSSSLCGEWQTVPQWKDVKWAKLSSVLPQAKIFHNRPQAYHIKQGNLGNCYFLAGLAAICERPDRIYNLFLTQEQNEQKYYSVKMLYKGKWMTIDLDEYIPVQGSSPAFSKAIDSSLWVLLLEKAWAKLYTSYKRIQSGFPQETLHDLTGAPIHNISISSKMNKEDQWNYLLKATQREYPMVCSSKPGSDTETSQSGVVLGHAYTLLAAVTLNFKGQVYRLIKLRNPWGRVEFKGEWSDYDKNWDLVDPKEKQRLGYKNDKDDGLFFIGFDQFCDQFKSITVGQVNDNASYVYKSAKDHHHEGCFFKIQIKKQGSYSLQVDKTPERSLEFKKQNDYNYPRAVVDVAEIKNGGLVKLQGFQSNLRTTSNKYKLEAGAYIVKVLVDFNPHFQTEFDVNLAIYAEYPCSIAYASSQQAAMIAGRVVNWKGEQEQQVPTMWNRQSCWGHKQSLKEEEAPFILDFNGEWMYDKPKGYVKGGQQTNQQNEFKHNQAKHITFTYQGGQHQGGQHQKTAWDALQGGSLPGIISDANAGKWDQK